MSNLLEIYGLSDVSIPKKRDSLIITDYNPFQTINDSIEVNEIINICMEEEVEIEIGKTDLMTKIFENINAVFDNMKEITSDMKNMQKKTLSLKKDYLRLMSQAKKVEEKKKVCKSKLQTGFTKPRPISNEMCDFLKLEHGTLQGRNVVTTAIHNYIVTNDLRDPDDRRIILPNAILKKLLHIEDREIILSYFNVQTFLKIHFI